MSKQNKKNLTGDERRAIIEWGMRMKNINPKFNRQDLSKKIEEIGHARGERTIDRLMRDINDLDKKNKGEKGWNLEQPIDWHRSDILYSQEVGLETRLLPAVRRTLGWYHANFGIKAEEYFYPRTLSYRWLKWANYFLQNVPTGVDEMDIFTVAQLYTVRDISNAVRGKVPFDDLEAWITQRPWENELQAKRYTDLIDADMYSPLRRLTGDIERIGISFIANTLMNICSLDEIKDLPQSKTWKLPSHQKAIFVEWCKENKQVPSIGIAIPSVKKPLVITFS